MCVKIPRMETMDNKIGYARVSSAGQNLDSQVDALKAAGCSRVFADKVSGVADKRPEWDRMVEYLRPGDTLVVCELSRMSRSLMHLLQVVAGLEAKGVRIQSLREHIDSSTPAGRAFVSIIGAISQMERELKSERAAAGRAAARARGKSGGRPRTEEAILEKARILSEHSDESIAQICTSLGIGRRTFYDYLARVKKNGTTDSNPS